MSRALAAILLGTAIVSGCVTQPPVDRSAGATVSVISKPSVEEWLDKLDTVEAMSTAEVMQQLETLDKNAGENQLFYYGVLHQRLQNYGAWTVARDTFQILQENQSLPRQQRQLAGILRQYNQSRINGHSRYSALLNEQAKLRESLSHAESERRQLEQKIQALTKLESAISTRQED